MNTLIDNWYIYIGLLALILTATFFINLFFKMPRKQQLAKVKEWLIFICLQAEREFGHGNGAIKLRFAYDQFVQTFPWMDKVVTFELFSMLVDEALVKVRLMLQTNKDVKRIVEQGSDGQ